MRDNLFRASVLVLLSLIAVGVFLHSENGHYFFSKDGRYGIIVDTRSGEYWDSTGSHYEPRAQRITAHQPSVDDQTAEDARINTFHACIWVHPDQFSECLSELQAARKAEREERAATKPLAPQSAGKFEVLGEVPLPEDSMTTTSERKR